MKQGLQGAICSDWGQFPTGLPARTAAPKQQGFHPLGLHRCAQHQTPGLTCTRRMPHTLVAALGCPVPLYRLQYTALGCVMQGSQVLVSVVPECLGQTQCGD